MKRTAFFEAISSYQEEHESGRMFAERIGVNASTLLSYRRGTKPFPKTIKDISDSLKLSDAETHRLFKIAAGFEDQSAITPYNPLMVAVALPLIKSNDRSFVTKIALRDFEAEPTIDVPSSWCHGADQLGGLYAVDVKDDAFCSRIDDVDVGMVVVCSLPNEAMKILNDKVYVLLDKSKESAYMGYIRKKRTGLFVGDGETSEPAWTSDAGKIVLGRCVTAFNRPTKLW
jgi:hypothetical protein